MDSYTFSAIIGVGAFAFGILGLAMALWFLHAQTRSAGALPPVHLGDNAQFTYTQAGGDAQIDIGAYTNIQACEDAMGDMARVVDNLELVQKLLPAVRQGAYRGDVTVTFEDIADESLKHLRRAAFTLAMHRDGKYAYSTTVAGREAALRRAQRNGGGHRA